MTICVPFLHLADKSNASKCTDFNSYAYVDTQLVPFMGLEETLAYLQTVAAPEANAAIEYLNICAAAGDFEDLEQRYQPQPWFF